MHEAGWLSISNDFIHFHQIRYLPIHLITLAFCINYDDLNHDRDIYISYEGLKCAGNMNTELMWPLNYIQVLIL